jgi:hypothetical protein
MPRDRHGKELKANVHHAFTIRGGRVIKFEIVVAHRLVIVLRDVEGNYRAVLTTDFDRCGGRTRELSIKAAVEEAKAYTDAKRFILGREETYEGLKLDRTEKFYLVEFWGGTTPTKHHGPYQLEEEYVAAARELHRELDDDHLLLLARVSALGFELMSFRAGFFNEKDADDHAPQRRERAA